MKRLYVNENLTTLNSHYATQDASVVYLFSSQQNPGVLVLFFITVFFNINSCSVFQKI